MKKYADIGVRVEDSFLLEESGLKRLSAAVPRTIEEIEAFMRQRPARRAAAPVDAAGAAGACRVDRSCGPC